MKKQNFLTTTPIAHRGIHDKYLENTIKAFEEAVKNNYIIELDVRLTKDNQVVVYHDYNLKRLFGINRDINDLTLKEIKKYKYIPTLKEVLDFVDGKVPIIIELKPDKRVSYLETRVAKLLDNYQGQIAIQSFNPLSLFWFKLNRKNIIRGYLLYTIKNDNFLIKLILNSKLLKKIIKPDYLGVNLNALENTYIEHLRKKYIVIGYTITTKEEYQKYKELADNFIIDIKKQETVPLRTVSQKE